MDKTVSHSLGRSITIVAAPAMFAACADQTPAAPKVENTVLQYTTRVSALLEHVL